MTVHFHTKHFEEVNLPLIDYMLLLLYEQKNNYKLNELGKLLKVAERTVVRIREDLVNGGYLIRPNKGVFVPTNKIYAI